MEDVLKCIGEFCYDPNSRPIGSGIFGSVYKGHRIDNINEEVAVKVIPASVLQQYKENLKLFTREIETLTKIKGKHVLELKDAMQSAKGNIYLITNYCNGGSLESEITRKKKIPVKDALKYLRQVAEAFEDIEKLNLKDSSGEKIVLIHRDIKPGNVLLHNGNAVLADFGFSKFIMEDDKSKRDSHTKLGTPLYMAPQILALQDYSSKCDVWSLGVVTYELIFGKKPWIGVSQPMLLLNIKQKPLMFEGNCHKEVKDLLSKMLQYDEKNRLNWKQVLEHPVFKTIEELDNNVPDDGFIEIVTTKPEKARISDNNILKLPGTQKSEEESKRDSGNEPVIMTKKRQDDFANADITEEDDSSVRQGIRQDLAFLKMSTRGVDSQSVSKNDLKGFNPKESGPVAKTDIPGSKPLYTNKSGKVRILEDSDNR